MGQGYGAVPKSATLQFLFTKTEQPFRLRQGAEGYRASEQPTVNRKGVKQNSDKSFVAFSIYRNPLIIKKIILGFCGVILGKFFRCGNLFSSFRLCLRRVLVRRFGREQTTIPRLFCLLGDFESSSIV